MFEPITDISTAGILVENCLEDNESLVARLLSMPSAEEKRGNGAVIGKSIFLWDGDDKEQSSLYKEVESIMLKASSVFLDKHNKSTEDYPSQQDHYKILIWSPPQPIMVAHSDSWKVDGVRVTPAITNILYLTSDFEGGELHFPDYDITFKPKAGDMVSFFSSTKHEVRPVLSGRRITTQLFFFDK